jgi:nitrous oxidase accessory protein
MPSHRTTALALSLSCSAVALLATAAGAQVTSVAELVNAINNGSPGDTVLVGPGTYELAAPLRPKAGMTIQGAGAGQTIVRNAASWNVGNTGLPDNATDHQSINNNAYLFDLGDHTHNVNLSRMTLSGPQLHGAIYGNNPDGLTLSHLVVEDFLWSGVRTFRLDQGNFHDNTFINAGGRAGVTSGFTGGSIYSTWTNDSEIHHNTILRTDEHPGNVFGIKGRQFHNTRIHHNTIKTSFSIELPFENDQFVEIDHNYMTGVVSIPKFAGGPVPEAGYTFHLHHNYQSHSYALEWARNGAEVDHNLFDFDTENDVGNLISNFGTAHAVGPTDFHDNLIKNPGRGLFWSEGVYDDYAFYNNHVIANTTVTPRTGGLFGFKPERDGVTTDWSKIEITDNIIEVHGLSRPLMRNTESYQAVIENNTLINVSDLAGFANPDTGEPRGPTEPFFFLIGRRGEYLIDGWDLFLAGDTDGDGHIGPTDLQQLAANWQQSGKTWADGDFNLDGTVDEWDLSLLAQRWSPASATSLSEALAAVAFVPEPGTLALIASAVALLLGRRPRRTGSAVEMISVAPPSTRS